MPDSEPSRLVLRTLDAAFPQCKAIHDLVQPEALTKEKYSTEFLNVVGQVYSLCNRIVLIPRFPGIFLYTCGRAYHFPKSGFVRLPWLTPTQTHVHDTEGSGSRPRRA